MTKEQIQDYRVNAIPAEIELLMAASFEMAERLDHELWCNDDVELLEKYRETLDLIITRAKYYYEKRKDDFGFEHMKLKRLINQTESLLVSVGG